MALLVNHRGLGVRASNLCAKHHLPNAPPYRMQRNVDSVGTFVPHIGDIRLWVFSDPLDFLTDTCVTGEGRWV